MKKKYLNKLGFFALFATILMTSCNDDDSFTYEVPEQAAVASVQLAVSASSDSQCLADVSITTADEDVTVYYMILPSSSDAPSSEDIFDGGDELAFSAPGTLTVSTDELSLSTQYTVYAITVNEDGLRSNQVFSQSYTQISSYAINVDTDYSGESYIGTSLVSTNTHTLTPTGTANQYLIDSAWGSSFVADATGNPAYDGQFVYSGTLTINSDLTVTIVGDDAWAPGGQGFYDPCSNMIAYSLQQALFSGSFTVEVYLTPNNL